jgi:hypothetical protein
MMDIAESINTNCDASLSMHLQTSSVPFDSPQIYYMMDICQENKLMKSMTTKSGKDRCRRMSQSKHSLSVQSPEMMVEVY